MRFQKKSLTKSIAARSSVKRYVRHNLGMKAPRGMGWITNPKKAAYNRSYYRRTKATKSIEGIIAGIILFFLFVAVKMIWMLISAIFSKIFSKKTENEDTLDHSNVRFFIKYKDARDMITERNINIISFPRSSAGGLLSAHCENLNKVRNFRFDRILLCVDLQTNKTVVDLRTHLNILYSQTFKDVS